MEIRWQVDYIHISIRLLIFKTNEGNIKILIYLVIQTFNSKEVQVWNLTPQS